MNCRGEENAVKNGELHRTVTIALSATEEKVSLAVHNEGHPIPIAEQSKLFDGFTRTRDAQASSQLGWGLGLTLVKGITLAHRGTVILESSERTGTRFKISIPIAQSDSVQPL